MAVLESCPKHNMVAYLEKTDGNAEFHEIIDFLARSSIHNALTIQEAEEAAKPVIAHHTAWERKPAKAEPSVLKDPTFDELADDTLDYMETEDA
ncbi:hypothetical protein Tco_0013117 [Tanacetum coccineum]